MELTDRSYNTRNKAERILDDENIESIVISEEVQFVGMGFADELLHIASENSVEVNCLGVKP